MKRIDKVLVMFVMLLLQSLSHQNYFLKDNLQNLNNLETVSSTMLGLNARNGNEYRFTSQDMFRSKDNSNSIPIPDFNTIDIKANKNINNFLTPSFRAIASEFRNAPSDQAQTSTSTNPQDKQPTSNSGEPTQDKPTNTQYYPPEIIKSNSNNDVYYSGINVVNSTPYNPSSGHIVNYDPNIKYRSSCPCEDTFKCPPCGRVFINRAEFNCPCAKRRCPVCPPLSIIHELATKKAVSDRRLITWLRYNARNIDKALTHVEKYADKVIEYEREAFNSAKNMEESSLKAQLARKNMTKNSEQAKMIARSAIMSEIKIANQLEHHPNLYGYDSFSTPLPEPGPFDAATSIYPLEVDNVNKYKNEVSAVNFSENKDSKQTSKKKDEKVEATEIPSKSKEVKKQKKKKRRLS